MITKETNQLVQEIFALIRNAADKTLVQKVDAYTKEKQNLKLMELATGSMDEREKQKFLKEIKELLEKEKYEAFGDAPVGQVEAPEATTAAAILKGSKKAVKEAAKSKAKEKPASPEKCTEQEYKLIAAIKAMMGDGLNEDRVREIVREEIRDYIKTVFKQ
jgi:hypothetical protein